MGGCFAFNAHLSQTSPKWRGLLTIQKEFSFAYVQCLIFISIPPFYSLVRFDGQIIKSEGNRTAGSFTDLYKSYLFWTLSKKIDFFIIQQNFRFFNSFNIIVKIILIIWFEYLFSENFLKSIDKFVKIIYNKVKGKIITMVILPLKQSLS